MIHIHHLRIGRSVFTVWLLEELGLDYSMTIYERDRHMRAPPELREAHPLGKSPVIEDGDLKLAESGAIAAYLIDTYDTDNSLAPSRDDVAARAVWSQWLHYSEGSAFAPLLIKLLLRVETQPSLISAFADGEVGLHLGYMEEFLGDKPFLLGANLQGPDFGATYIAHMAERLGLLQPYPRLSDYAKRNMARPAFMRGDGADGRLALALPQQPIDARFCRAAGIYQEGFRHTMQDTMPRVVSTSDRLRTLTPRFFCCLKFRLPDPS